MIDWFQFLAWKMKFIQGKSPILMLDRYKARDGEISTSSKTCVVWQRSQNGIFLFESFAPKMEILSNSAQILFYPKLNAIFVFANYLLI